MTMIRVTVKGETPGQAVVVTWSPEYGFTVAGNWEHQVDVEEIEPRDGAVNVPVLTQADLQQMAAAMAPPRHLTRVPDSGSDPEADEPNYLEGVPTKEEVLRRKKCGACNHPMHEDNGCGLPVRIGQVTLECDCSTAFEVDA